MTLVSCKQPSLNLGLFCNKMKASPQVLTHPVAIINFMHFTECLNETEYPILTTIAVLFQ